jgi:hypothetical protein
MKIPKQIKVKLTKADIKEGTPNNTATCPIALRLTKEGYIYPDINAVEPKVYKALVTSDPDHYGGHNYTQRFCFHLRPSKSAVEFIEKFDGGLKVKPVTLVFYVNKCIEDWT